MPEIRRPDVEITQEFVTTSPSVLTPTLRACLFGPCFRIVSAFDDDGNPESDALAGTYRDGYGVVAYDLPGIGDEDDISGFADDVRVFLVMGEESTELNGESDEEVICDDYDGDYAYSTKKLTDVDALFTQVGVEAGDVVRLTFRGEIIDIPIDTVDSDTVLTLETNIIAEDLTGVDFDVVRNPAEFIISSLGVFADVEIGTDADHIEFKAAEFKADGTTPGDYVGEAGDNLSLSITESEIYHTGSDGVVGDCIFNALTGTFLTTVGVRGDVTGTAYYVFIGDETAATNGLSFREILQVFSNTQLTIETGEGEGGTALEWTVGSELMTGSDGVTTGATTITSTTGGFTAGIPNTGVPGAPTNTTYIEIEGDGVYEVTNIDSDNQLTLGATVGTATDQNFTIIDEEQDGAVNDGTTGDLIDFASISLDFTTITDPTSKSVNRADAEATAITSVTNADNLEMGAFAASANGLSFKIVDTTVPLILSWDGDTETIGIQIARVDGLTTNTYAEVADAIDTPADPSYNVNVDDVIDASVSGSGTFVSADLPISETFDGGYAANQLVLDADLIGSGTPTANVYASWKGLRVDVSDQAETPALLSFDNSTDVESDIGPISTENPLALAFFFALANSPNNSVDGLGVSEVSAAKPFGTSEAYLSCLEYLQAEDVYFMVPLTQDPVVHGLLDTHVTSMSEPENKGERVGFFNQALPEYVSATNVASGTQGNTGTVSGESPADFSTSVDLAAAGVQSGDILVVSSLSDPADDALSVVNGTVGPLYGALLVGVKAGDDFVAQFDGTDFDPSWDSLVDVDWTIYRAGAAIASASQQATELALIGAGFENRRMFFHWPDTVYADIGGTNFGIEGFYAAAAWAGKGGENPPQQGFTNTTISGFTGLAHSSGYFTNSQLNSIAGGGTWITIQESQSAPLKCRHQLATDVSTIQKREFSITKAIDYTAKFLRIALSKQIGKFNITQAFLDALSTSVQGLGRHLVESKVIREFTLSSIEQDEDQPDTVNITVLLTPMYPANYIALTLQI
jgi:hypothetical protein